MSMKNKMNKKLKMLLILIGFILLMKTYLLSKYIDIDKEFKPIVSEYKDNDASYYCRIDHCGWKLFSKGTPISTSTETNPCELLISVNAKEEILKADLIKLSFDYGETVYIADRYQIKGRSYDEKNEYYFKITRIPVPFYNNRIIKVRYKVKIKLKDKVIEKEIEAKFKCIMKVESGFKLFRAV